jgi:mono/diheme cytochrome c family protein
MQHIRQLQTALTILLVALVLLIISGVVLIYSYSPGKQTAVVASTGTAQRATDPVKEASAQPAALDEVAQAGKSLFTNNCTVCHSLGAETVVGPGLKGLNQRRPEAWLISWIKNSQQVIESGDQYAVTLYNKFNKTPMPAYADFSDDQIRSILKYIEVAGQ